MKIKFKGLEGQSEMTLRGLTFTKGKAVAVDDDAFAARLLRLDYFAEVKSRAKKNDKDSD